MSSIRRDSKSNIKETLSNVTTDDIQSIGNEKSKSEKQKQKEEERQKRYWNSMISRKEANDMVESSTMVVREQLKLAHIQIRTLTQVIIDKDIATEDELNEVSRDVMNSIYQPQEKDDTDEQQPNESK